MILSASLIRTAHSRVVSVGFLEDVAIRLAGRRSDRAMKFVVLQAQKISVSGKHHCYSRKEGSTSPDSRRHAKTTVYFFSSGDGTENDGETEAVYREIASALRCRWRGSAGPGTSPWPHGRR